MSAIHFLSLFRLKMGQASPQAELITGMKRCFSASVGSIWVNGSFLHQSSHQQRNAKFGRFRTKQKKNEEEKKIFSGGFFNLILICPFSCLFKFEWNKVVFFFFSLSTLVCSFKMDEVHHRGLIKECHKNACCCSH